MLSMKEIPEPYNWIRLKQSCITTGHKRYIWEFVVINSRLNGLSYFEVEKICRDSKGLMFDSRKQYKARFTETEGAPYVILRICRKGWWYAHIYDSWDQLLSVWEFILERKVIVEKTGSSL